MKRIPAFGWLLLCCFLSVEANGRVVDNDAENASRDESVALGLAGIQTDASTPDVIFLFPEAPTLKVHSEILRLRVLVLSPAIPLTGVTMSLNGQIMRKIKLEAAVDHERRKFLNQDQVTLKPGENVIAITATNEKASSRPVVRRVIYEPPVAGKPNLVLLAIGISEYQESSFNHRHANADANAFAKLISQANAQGLYGNVKSLVLSNAQATRAGILKGLDWLNSQATLDNDVRVLFLGGSLDVDYHDNTYFLSSEHKPKTDLEIANIKYISFLGKLSQRPGPVFIFVDASGSAGRGRRNLFAITREYSYAGDFYTYVSSDADEPFVAPANAEHSAFATALMEGLRGRADFEVNGRKDGVIDSLEMQLWLQRRVAELTSDRQHPAFFGSSKPVAFFKPAAPQP